MVGKFKKAVIALAMGATLAGVAAAPAEAQRYRGDRHRIDTGEAIGIGLLGLGLGVALSQSNRGGGYYEYRSYDYPRYRPNRNYRNYYRNCWREQVWDRYYRGWVMRTVCR